MRLVYVAGPFRAPTHWGVVQNVRRAEAVAIEVWRLGAAALCPHLNTANFEGAAPDSLWLEGTMEMLRRCDAVMMVPGWLASKGATAERAEAVALGKPVFDPWHYGALAAWIASLPLPKEPTP